MGEFATAVTLDAQSPDSCFDIALEPAVVTQDAQVFLTAADAGCADRGLHDVLVTASGGGFIQTTTVQVLVGGSQIYLPLVLRGP